MHPLDFLAIFAAALILFVYLLYPSVLYVARSVLRLARKNRILQGSPSVSILVPTYNEGAVIESKIRDLLRVDYPKDLYEVLLVDSGSQDGTVTIARKFLDSGVIVLEQERRQGKANAINFGLKAANGEIIIITDANARFEDTAISGLVARFDENVGAVLPRLIPSGNVDLWNRLFYKMHDVYKTLESDIDSVFIVFGELFAFRRTLIDKIDEDAISDDLEIAFTVRRKGRKIKYAYDVEVTEKIPSSEKETRIQRTRRAFGILQVMNKNRNMLFNPKFGSYGLLIFPTHYLQLTILPFLILFLFGFSLFHIAELVVGLDSVETMWSAIFVVLLSASLSLAKIRQIFMVGLNFLFTQFHIILALIDIARGKSYRLWEKISSTRD